MAEELVMTIAAIRRCNYCLSLERNLTLSYETERSRRIRTTNTSVWNCIYYNFHYITVGGLISVLMVVSELEAKLAGVSSIMSATMIGLTFTFTILSGLNTLVDLKADKIMLAKLGIIKTEDQPIKEKNQPPNNFFYFNINVLS